MISEFYIKYQGKLKKVYELTMPYPMPTFDLIGTADADMDKLKSFGELFALNQRITFTRIDAPYLQKDNTAIYLFDADNYLKQ